MNYDNVEKFIFLVVQYSIHIWWKIPYYLQVFSPICSKTFGSDSGSIKPICPEEMGPFFTVIFAVIVFGSPLCFLFFSIILFLAVDGGSKDGGRPGATTHFTFCGCVMV